MNDKCKQTANGLKWITLQSKAESIGDIDQNKLVNLLGAHFTSLAYVVAWLDYKVLIGLWQEGNFRFYKNESFDLKYVQRLRVFDAQKELHVWRTQGKWKGRFRIDGEGKQAEAVEANQLLFGTKGERLAPEYEYARIEEDRGTMLILPLKNVHFDKGGNPSTRVFIKTHNYVEPNAVHQASYVDCRFVAFTDADYNELS